MLVIRKRSDERSMYGFRKLVAHPRSRIASWPRSSVALPLGINGVCLCKLGVEAAICPPRFGLRRLASGRPGPTSRGREMLRISAAVSVKLGKSGRLLGGYTAIKRRLASVYSERQRNGRPKARFAVPLVPSPCMSNHKKRPVEPLTPDDQQQLFRPTLSCLPVRLWR